MPVATRQGNGPMLQLQPTIESGSAVFFTPDAVLSTVGAVIVGIGQAWAILHGIRQMQKASAEQIEQCDRNAERSRQEIAERDRQFWERVAERDRESERRHQELMASMNERLDQGREQSQVMVRALQTLIERTAPPPHETTSLVVLAR